MKGIPGCCCCPDEGGCMNGMLAGGPKVPEEPCPAGTPEGGCMKGLLAGGPLGEGLWPEGGCMNGMLAGGNPEPIPVGGPKPAGGPWVTPPKGFMKDGGVGTIPCCGWGAGFEVALVFLGSACFFTGPFFLLSTKSVVSGGGAPELLPPMPGGPNPPPELPGTNWDQSNPPDPPVPPGAPEPPGMNCEKLNMPPVDPDAWP